MWMDIANSWSCNDNETHEQFLILIAFIIRNIFSPKSQKNLKMQQEICFQEEIITFWAVIKNLYNNPGSTMHWYI